MDKSHIYDICKVDAHRASYAKQLRSKKNLENMKQNDTVIPEWLFQELCEKKLRKICNPKPLREIARENVNIDDRQLNKELAKKIINP